MSCRAAVDAARGEALAGIAAAFREHGHCPFDVGWRDHRWIATAIGIGWVADVSPSSSRPRAVVTRVGRLALRAPEA